MKTHTSHASQPGWHPAVVGGADHAGGAVLGRQPHVLRGGHTTPKGALVHIRGSVSKYCPLHHNGQFYNPQISRCGVVRGHRFLPLPKEVVFKNGNTSKLVAFSMVVGIRGSGHNQEKSKHPTIIVPGFWPLLSSNPNPWMPLLPHDMPKFMNWVSEMPTQH